jgi:hypothetical protein
MPSRCGQSKFAFAFFDTLRSLGEEIERESLSLTLSLPHQSEIECADIFVKITTIK